MGRGIPKVVEENKDIKLKGETKEYVSREFLSQYKFTISFENASHVGYTSDRIVEAMRVNSIPIYWGNPLIGREFNIKSFVNYHDFEKEVKDKIPKIFFKIPIIRILTDRYAENAIFNEMIKRIIEIDDGNNELWEEMLKEPWYNENKPSIFLNKEIIRKRLREIIESGKQI